MQSASADSRASRVTNVSTGQVPGSVSAPGTKSARLFPDMFRKVDPARRLKVLEIGRAQPETVEFFSHYKCRLQFADVYAASSLLEEQGGKTEAQLSAELRKALDLPKDEKFDLCLFWDVLQYMTGPAIRALCGVLEPHLHKETRGHALGVHSVLTRCERAEYAIASLNEFRLKDTRLPTLDYRPHPQAELAEMLTVFRIDRAILLGDGTVEMLLKTKPYWDSA